METQSLIIEPGTFKAEDLCAELFHPLPTDNRYQAVEYHAFFCKNTISGASQLNFELPPWSSASLYLLSSLMMEVTTKITKSNGDKPGTAKVVFPVNNVLHSLFSSVRVYFNDFCINPQADLYNYKSYFMTVLSYSDQCKFSHLNGQGFYSDDTNAFDDVTGNNDGAVKRASLYKLEDSVTFVGKVLHDFAGIDQGILNNVTIRVEFQLSQDAWKLMCPAGDVTEKYKLQISDAKLHCAVASCTESTWSSISRQLDHKDATYHFRRVEMVGHPIPKASKTYMSDSLFPQNVLPAKIIIAFLETDRFLGSYTLNPFSFKRKWESTSGLMSSGDKVYIKNIELTLNGKPITSLSSSATEHADMMSFVRFNYYTQYLGSPYTTSISYKDFLSDYSFFPYDLSTSSSSGFEMLVPSIRAGHVRIQVEFSNPTFKQITMLVYSEFPSTLAISKSRQVSMSYPT